jgi:hypothetical protein
MTGMDDCAPTTAALATAAQLTIDQHQARPGRMYDPGTCTQCTPQGCPQLAWAERTLAQLVIRGRQE